ncbi:MAG: hypothetical protein WA989_02400 [Henriciella sp.]|uniref:hypothetical protein n=1 Tax=Henriciella sp. TaxID=1968823 RepID=UPI003C71995A
MNTRVAALALAATPLTALPALADAPASTTAVASPALSLSVGDASFYVSIGHDRWRGRDGRYHSRSRYGQAPWETRQLRRSAMQQCAAEIQRQGYRVGYRDIDIDDDIRTRQTGRNSFLVRFDDVEFEGRRRELERDISCSVSYGRVVSLSGIPRPGSRGYGYRNSGYGYSYGHSGNRGYSWGNRGQSHSSYGRSDRHDNDHGRDRGRGRDRDDDRGRRTGPGGQRTYGDDGLRGGRRGS